MQSAIWMRIVSRRGFVSGQCGLIGPYVVSELERQGHTVAGFDLVDGQDIRDPDAVIAALEDCTAAIHLAAADDPQPAEVIVDTNVLGALNVLRGSIVQGVQRVVTSNVDALGIFMSEAPPDYLPLDDSHPPARALPTGLPRGGSTRKTWRAPFLPPVSAHYLPRVTRVFSWPPATSTPMSTPVVPWPPGFIPR